MYCTRGTLGWGCSASPAARSLGGMERVVDVEGTDVLIITLVVFNYGFKYTTYLYIQFNAISHRPMQPHPRATTSILVISQQLLVTI